MDGVLTALRAAAEATRLRILCLCARGELTVTELTQILGQSQPRVSRHLKEMCSAGLLDRYQEGAWAFFNIASDGPASRLAGTLLEQIPENDETLVRDLRRLEAVKANRADVARAYFRENAEEWDRIRSFHVDDRQVEAVLLSLVPYSPNTRLLDIGTGTGRMLQLLSPVVGQAVGVDSSREMLTVARANLAEPGFSNCSVRQADMARLPWPNGSFDLVVAHMVLHFTDDPAAAVAEASRVLRPDGRLLIVDFASHDIEELRAKFAHRRLGFRRQEVDSWCLESALSVRSVTALEGDPLTVMIWDSAKLPAVDHRPEPIGNTVATWARGATL